MVYQARHVKRYGLRLADASYDWEQVQSHVRQVITTIRGGTSEEASAKLEKQGITVITGEAGRADAEWRAAHYRGWLSDACARGRGVTRGWFHHQR